MLRHRYGSPTAFAVSCLGKEKNKIIKIFGFSLSTSIVRPKIPFKIRIQGNESDTGNSLEQLALGLRGNPHIGIAQSQRLRCHYRPYILCDIPEYIVAPTHHFVQLCGFILQRNGHQGTFQHGLGNNDPCARSLYRKTSKDIKATYSSKLARNVLLWFTNESIS